jgi:hypothetical protein
MKTFVRLILAVALLAPTLAACNNDDLPPATKFSAFRGTVTDALTNKPIENATVIVDAVLTTTTDANGMFSIAKVPSGIVDYTIKADGYKDITTSVNAEPGKALELNAAMQRPTPP